MSDRLNKKTKIIVRYLDDNQNFVLFLFFALGYFFWRYPGFNYLVWDDTSSASYNVFANNTYYSLAKDGFIPWMLKDVFANIQGDGYRPFIAFMKRIGIGYFLDSKKSIVFWALLNSIINGLFAVVYFHFSKRFVQTRILALFAVLLLFFSTPFLSAGLIVYSCSHSLIPLIICAGFFCYYKITEQEKDKVLWITGLFLIMLFGPLFREYLSIFPLLIIFLEFQRERRVTWIVWGAVVCFLHAIFPTVLIKILFFNDLPIRPVFLMGNLGAYLKAGTEGSSFVNIFLNLHWRIFIDIISIYPSSVFVLALMAFILKYRKIKNEPIAGADTLFLMVFFSISFIPFLKAFNEQVHLLYCMVPLSILLAKAIQNLWLILNTQKKAVHISRIIFIVFLCMIMLDHTLNVYAVRKVTGEIYKGITTTANWFVKNVPEGTPVITNAHHLEDIRFFSNGHIDPWGAPGGIPDQRKWMHNPSDLQRLLDDSRQMNRDVYFFEVEVLEISGQRGIGRRLFYVRDNNVKMEDLGILHTIQARYTFLDPLKFLIPMGQITWPGPPDLEFDFYRGPALDGTPFCREVFARYHLYKAADHKVIGASENPQLVEEKFNGFNLVLYLNRIYAIPQPEGAFEINRINSGGYSRAFEGDSLSEVKQLVTRFVEQKNKAGNRAVDFTPQLIEEGYRGFNIIGYRTQIYALLQIEGPFDLQRFTAGAYNPSFKGDNINQVKMAIDRLKSSVFMTFKIFCRQKIKSLQNLFEYSVPRQSRKWRHADNESNVN